MSRRSTPYPLEFRQQMVELLRIGPTPEELSREFEPSAQAIRNWVVQADRDEGRRGDGLIHAAKPHPTEPITQNRLGSSLRRKRKMSAPSLSGHQNSPPIGILQPPQP